MDQDEWYVFDVVWEYQEKLSPFILRFFPKQQSVEMFDVMKRRSFLTRASAPGLHLSQLTIGSSVCVLGRQLLVTGYADDKTSQLMECYFQRAIVIFKKNCNMARILEAICGTETNSPLIISRIKMLVLDLEDMKKLGLTGQCHYRGPSVAVELIGKDSIRKSQEILEIIKCSYDISELCYNAPDAETADYALCVIFNKVRQNEPKCGNGVLCLIKPNAVRQGHIPLIIKAILGRGFEIATMDTVVMERSLAEGFLAIYRGVVPEYLPWIEDLVSGMTVALEIELPSGEDAYQAFHEFVGPLDPDVARSIRPDTLRARFGQDKVFNAIHSTDLQRDCQWDLDFIFRYVARSVLAQQPRLIKS